MKRVIEIALVYLAIQVIGSLAGMFVGFIIQLVTKGTIDLETATSNSLIPSLLIAYALTLVYLRMRGWLTFSKTDLSPVSVGVIALSIVICGSGMLLIELLLSYLSFIPDLMKPTFDIIQQSTVGILCIAIIGPVIEELVFRGAIMRELLQRYSPTKSILISGMVFGLIHINPIQVIGAMIFGFILGWLYYRTRSLVPGIVLHVLNNSVSVYLNLNYSEDTTMHDLLPHYYLWIVASVVLLAISVVLINKRKV